jgi:O-antigen/teichoic acid export membrane protein
MVPSAGGAALTATRAHIERHFRTDHLMAGLKSRSVRGGAVTLSSQAVKFVLQLGSTAVLARLLTPADFGLVAMVAAFTGFVSLFKDLGLSMATVQRAEITHEQVSTLFWINVALSIVLMGVAAGLAPTVAWFYGEPRLTWIMLAVAGTFVFGGLSAQHTALLRRQMRFTALAAIEIGAMAAGIAVAILMAWRNFGYWSLVGMGAASAASTVTLCWVLSGWRPGWPSRQSGVGAMVAFGSSLTASSVLNYFNRQFDNLIVGWSFGPTALGLYAKAYGLLALPISQINAPLAAVAMPALCRLQSEPQRYRNYYLTGIQAMVSVGMPLVAFAFICAEDLIVVILGPQWIGAALLFRLLAPAAFAGTFNVASGWAFLSLGRPNRMLLWRLISAPTTIIALFVGMQWGVQGVAVAVSIAFCIVQLPMIAHALVGSPIALRDLGGVLWRPAVSAAAAAALLHWISPWGESSATPIAAKLCMNLILYGLLYVGSSLVIPGGRSNIGAMATAVKQAIDKRGVAA